MHVSWSQRDSALQHCVARQVSQYSLQVCFTLTRSLCRCQLDSSLVQDVRISSMTTMLCGCAHPPAASAGRHAQKARKTVFQVACLTSQVAADIAICTQPHAYAGIGPHPLETKLFDIQKQLIPCGAGGALPTSSRYSRNHISASPEASSSSSSRGGTIAYQRICLDAQQPLRQPFHLRRYAKIDLAPYNRRCQLLRCVHSVKGMLPRLLLAENHAAHTWDSGAAGAFSRSMPGAVSHPFSKPSAVAFMHHRAGSLSPK